MAKHLSSKLILASLVFCSATAHGQWDDIHKISRGGEPTITTDMKGTVYVTTHQPTQVLVSRDWGATFTKIVDFPESLGDMVGLPLDDKGTILATFMPPKINGMLTRLSKDYGKTWEKGEGVMDRPLDREWPVKAPDGSVYMIFSDGYIGGPASKGVYLVKSTDQGLTWKQVSRIDKEPAGMGAVDPHMAISTTGRIYAYWAVTPDRDTLSAHRVAISDDGGKTWSHYQTLDTTDAKLGDVQERWMLGGVACYGAKEVGFFFVRYRKLDDQAFLETCYRLSHDGGLTFGEPIPVSTDEELRKTLENRKAMLLGKGPNDILIQSVPWACYDTKGKFHIVYYENSDGQKDVGGTNLDLWHLRHKVDGSPSERVANDFAAVRPPMDFISCVADEKYLYVVWVETPDMKRDWQFSGDLWVGRKALKQ